MCLIFPWLSPHSWILFLIALLSQYFEDLVELDIGVRALGESSGVEMASCECE